MERAETESRILVTGDKDFGELAYGRGLAVRCGIILFRLSEPSPQAECDRILQVLQGPWDWTGHFTVVTEDRIRMRPLPKRE